MEAVCWTVLTDPGVMRRVGVMVDVGVAGVIIVTGGTVRHMVDMASWVVHTVHPTPSIKCVLICNAKS